ncbi:DUF4350 domain-containing protein [Lysobacter fragariae]
MSVSREAQRNAWLTVLGLVVAGALTAWFLFTYKRVQVRQEMPRIGEARTNPLFALKLALEKDDIRVNARRRLQMLSGTRSQPQVKLAPRDTLVLFNDPRTLTSEEVSTLLRWVEGGGHLIVRTPPHGFMARNAPTPLLEALKLVPLPDNRESECETLHTGRADNLPLLRKGSPGPVPTLAPDAGDNSDDSNAPASVDDDKASADTADARSTGYLFCGARRFSLTGANPERSWGDLSNGYVFARIVRGAGRVDVLADLDPIDNDHLGDRTNADFARQLLAPNYRAGTVHLVYAAEMPSLWSTLLLRSWMAWGPLLLALLLWLWARMQRQGPLLVAPPAERRSLLEHIVASGEHAYRYGYAHLLYAAVRNAFLARLRRRDPQAAALEGEPQLALLSQRFPDIATHDIRDALMPPFANDHAAFRSRIATLIRLRNRL